MASLTKVKVHNIDTSVTFVYDPIILMNFGSTQANTDVGFVFNRDGGISSNVALYWNETLDRIVIGYTTATGLPNSNIAVSKYANVAADWYFGNLAGGTTNNIFVSANVLPTANAFYNFGSPTARWNVGYFAATTLDIGGSQISVDPTNGFKFVVGGTGTPIYLASNGAVNGTTLSSATTLTVGTSASIGTNITVGGYVNAAGNVMAATGIFNALTVNGNESVTGFLNVTGNILSTGAIHNALTVNGVTNTTNYINTTANVLATGGIFNALTVNGNHNATGFINTTGNISASQGQFATINTSGLINSTANISASMFSGGQIYVSGLVNAGGNVLAQTGIFNFLDVNGNIVVGAVTTPGAGHSIIGNVQQSGAGTVWINTPGNLLAALGRFGQISSDGLINTSANVMAAVGRFGSISSDGFINTSGNISAASHIGGSVVVSGVINTASNVLTSQITVFGNAQIGSLSTAGVVHSIVGNVQQTGAGTIFYNTPGNIMAAIGRFGSISTDGFINTSANLSAAVGLFGSITSTGFINTSGNVSAAIHTGGQVSVTGYINTAGNISTAQLNAGQINTTGNVLSTGGVFNTLTINGTATTSSNRIIQLNSSAQYIAFNANLSAGSYNPFVGASDVGIIFTGLAGQGSGNLTIAPWSVTQAGIRIIGTTGLVQIPGQLTINANNSPTAIAVGGTSGVGNIGIAGTPFNTGFFTSINATSNVLATSATFGTAQINGNQSVTGFLNVTGNVLASAITAATVSTTGLITSAGINSSANILATGGIFNSLTVNGNESVTGFLNVTGNIIATSAELGSVEASGVIYANGTAVTTSTTSGALRTSGGAGIAGNTVIGGILTAGRTTGVNVANFTDTAGAFYGTANSWVQLGIQNASTATGASTDFIAYANNGDNNTGWIDMGITGQNYVNQNGQYAITGANDGYVFMSAPSGTTGGGNLVIATGNTGVYNDVVIATGGFDNIHEQARFIDGVGLKLIQGTSSINPSTGALIVQGGVGIGGNLNVQGDIKLNGNLFLTGNAITFDTNNLSIADSLIYLATGNSGDLVDIGFVGHFINPGYQHTGFVRDATDGTWKLFANVVPEPTTTVDFTNATYSNIKVGNLSAVSAGFDGNVTAAYHIGTIGTAAQPVITSLGTLTSLTASGLINTSGNILATGGVFNALTVNGGITSTGFINTSGNVSAAVHTGGQVSVSGFINTAGNVSAATLISGQISTTGNVLSTGLRVFGNTSIGIAGAISGQFHTVVGNITQSTSGGVVYINTSGNVLAAQGSFGSINSTGFINTSGNVSAATVLAGAINSTGFINTSGNVSAATVLAGAVTSTGFINTSGNISAATVQAGQINTTGNVLSIGGVFNALTVNGNETVTGFLNVTGNVMSAAGTFNALTVNGNATVTSNIIANWITTSSGNLIIAPASNSAVVIPSGDKLFVLDTTSSTTTTNGALIVSGAVGVGGNINAGSLATPGSAHNFAGNLIVTGIGAIQVPAGTTTQRPSSTTAGQIRFNTDTNSFEGYGNAWAALGGGGGGGGTPGGVSTTVQYNNGGAFAGAVNLNYIVANGAVIVSSGTSSTTSATGALQVIGGVGITENINAGGSISAVGLINTAGNILASTLGGGAVSVSGLVNAGGNILAQAATFNALDVNGNVEIGLISTPGAGHSVIGNVTQSGAGTVFYNTPGNIMAAQGFFGSINSTGLINTSGNILTTGAVHNALTVNGATTQAGTLTVSSGFVNSVGNILATGGVFNALTVNGGITSTGFFNTSANISGATVLAGTITTTGTLTAAGINSTGNILGTGGILSSLTVNGGITSSGFFNTSANISGAVLLGGTITTTGTLTAGFVNSTGNVVASGAVFNTLNVNSTVGTNLNPSASNTYTLGSTTNWWSRVWSVAVNAQYADLAETYASDRDYIPGTVLVFGGEREVTIATQSHDPAIAGVVSTKPAYHMNAAAEGTIVALQGRVPTKVKGPVRKGDRLVSSDIQGAAERLDMTKYQPGCIIGKALEDIADDTIQTIEVVVGRV